jgi:hypothetical protein
MKRRSFIGLTGVGGIGLGGSMLLVGGSPTYRIELEASTFEYVLSMRSYGPDVGEVTTRITDLEPDVRETVETAIEEGRIEVADPSTALLTFLDRPETMPRYVVDGDVPHALDAKLPAFIVRFEELPSGDVDGEPATVEEFVEEITDDRGRRGSPVHDLVERGGYRTYRLDPAVETFVENGGYIETREAVGRITIDVEDPGPPYEITASEASIEEVHGGTVIELADAPAGVRELLRTVIDRRRVGVDAVSVELAELVASYDYLRVDDWFYGPEIEETGPTHLPVAFEATVVDGSVRPSDPARIELSISNTGDERIGVSSGVPGPFGVLRAESEGEDDRVTLWSDAYAESDHVHTTAGRVRAVNDVGIVTELASGETRTRAYEIGRWRLEPGTYTVDESIGIERYATDENGKRRSEGTTFPYELRIRIR